MTFDEAFPPERLARLNATTNRNDEARLVWKEAQDALRAEQRAALSRMPMITLVQMLRAMGEPVTL